MSHFAVLVILPSDFGLPDPSPEAEKLPLEAQGKNQDQILTWLILRDGAGPQEQPAADRLVQEQIERLLAPYDENIQVEEYDRECYCLGSEAHEKARQIRDRFVRHNGLKDIGQIRADYWALPEDEQTSERWEEMIGRWKRLYDVTLARFTEEFRTRADPECPNCHGTGTYRSQYNPASKWDWWRIGGRWDGTILGPDVADSRRTHKGFNFSDANEHWENNSARIKDLLIGEELTFVPFAIVTPDGAWHERGEMGWWGVVRDEQAATAWHTQIRDIYRAHAEHVGVVVDCHI